MAKVGENIEPKKEKTQDSTSDLPMVDLSGVVDAVKKIRENAVENAPLVKVAKALEYKAATSTPFYRRLVAARLFGLIANKSASLTQDAVDYIKPHDEQMKSRVLRDAINRIPVYKRLLENYAGKKLNVELVANAIAKECNLTDACAIICAKVFESSVRFAGMLSADGCVDGSSPQPPTPAQSDKKEDSKPLTKSQGEVPAADVPDTQGHKLYLNREKTRVFSITGPLDISKAEYDRICNWLKFTLLIDEKSEGAETA